MSRHSLSIFFSLFFISNHILSDTFSIVEDFNYEVVNSSSMQSSQADNFSFTHGEKIFFESKNAYTNLHENRLWVTDGTPEGTSVVAGLPSTNHLVEYIEVQSKLYLLFHSTESSFDYDFWVLDLDTEQSSLVKTFDKPEDPTFGFARTAMRFFGGDNILLVGRERSVVTYNITQDTFNSIELADSILGSESFFVLGNDIFYENQSYNPITGEFLTESFMFKTNLLTGSHSEVMALDFGFGHFVFDGLAYFWQRIPHVDGLDLWVSDGTKDGTKLLNSDLILGDFREAKIIDETLVLKTAEGYFLRKVGESEPVIFTDPIEHSPFRHSNFNIVKQGDFYYILAGLEAGGLGIIKTNFDDVFDLVAESNRDAPFAQNWHSAREIFIENNELKIYTGPDNKEYPGEEEFYAKGTKLFQYDSDSNNLELTWDGRNYGNLDIYRLIHPSNPSIVYAYDRSIGAEPWFIPFDDKPPVLLKDINTNARTGDTDFFNSFSERKKSNSDRTYLRATTPFYKGDFTFDGESITEIEELVINDNVAESFEVFDIDLKYNYLKYSTPTSNHLIVEDNDTKERQILDSRLVYSSNISLFRGDFVRIKSSLGDDYALDYKSVDGDYRVELDIKVFNLEKFGKRLVAYGSHSADEQHKFIVVNDKQVEDYFTVPMCASCSSNQPEVYSLGEAIWVRPERNSDKLFYYTPSVKSKAQLIDLEVRGFNKFTVIVSTEEYSLISVESAEYEQKIYRLVHSTNELELIGDGAIGLALPQELTGRLYRKMGEVFVAATNKDLLIFDKDLTLINRIKAVDMIGGNTEHTTIDLLECHIGYCYIEANYVNDGIYKVDISGASLELIPFDGAVIKTFWKRDKNIFFEASSSLFGKELFSLGIETHDSDGDNIDDSIELLYALNPNDATDGSLDLDNDGLTNSTEATLGTNLAASDTDADGVSDSMEVELGFNPVEYDLHLHDRDSDGLSYRKELRAGADPLNPDSDGDGTLDGVDLFPTNSAEATDHDLDGLGDNEDLDDDNDGMPDAWEEQYELDPLDPNDANRDYDADGVSNVREYELGTNPRAGPVVEQANSSGGGGALNWLIIWFLVCVAKVRMRQHLNLTRP